MSHHTWYEDRNCRRCFCLFVCLFVCLLLLLLLFCFCFCLHQIMELDTERRWAGLLKLENQYSRINVRDALSLIVPKISSRTRAAAENNQTVLCSWRREEREVITVRKTSHEHTTSKTWIGYGNSHLACKVPGRALVKCDGPRVIFALVKLP